MATMTVTREVTLKTIDCGTCGTPFALPERIWQQCYDEGGFFYCPLGHSRGWNAGNKRSVVEELKAEKARLESQLQYAKDRVEAAKRSTAAVKGQLTKLEKRVANGVCPCCQRSFANLHRHIKTKHPDFATAE